MTVESLWTAPTETAKQLNLAIDETSLQQQQHDTLRSDRILNITQLVDR